MSLNSGRSPGDRVVLRQLAPIHEVVDGNDAAPYDSAYRGVTPANVLPEALIARDQWEYGRVVQLCDPPSVAWSSARQASRGRLSRYPSLEAKQKSVCQFWHTPLSRIWCLGSAARRHRRFTRSPRSYSHARSSGSRAGRRSPRSDRRRRRIDATVTRTSALAGVVRFAECG